MDLTREQVNTILRNAPVGTDKKKLLDGLVLKGYKLEGVNSNDVIQAIQPKPKETFGQDLKGDFLGIGKDIISGSQKRAENITGIKESFKSGEKGLGQATFQTVGQLAGAGADAIGSVFKGAVKMALSPKSEQKVKELATNFGAKVIERPEVQKLVKWYDGLDENTQDTIDAVGGIASLASEFVGVGLAKRGTQAGVKVAKEGLDVVGDVAKAGVKRVDSIAGDIGRVAGDLVPNRQRVINTQVTKALDLAPGDLDKLARSTGNELGVFMAEKNLIGVNKAETVQNLQNLFDTSYKQVRDEIGKVKTIFKNTDVPNYKTALTEVQKKVKGVVGLEDVNKEVSALLKKTTITLDDVQRAKELIDEHFKLYKVTGDVAEEASKKGMANVRRDLRTFIETETKKSTGIEIQPLNNDVMTSKSILEAVKTRSPKGLTKSNLKLGDLGAFGVGSVYGGPVGGLATVLFKKIVESPTVRLRFAKWLDKLEDAKKLKLKNQLEKGIVPDEVIKATGIQDDIPNQIAKNIKTKNSSISPKSTTKSLKGKGEIPKTNLINEAKKYKSADEFVKAQGKPVYHGTSAKFEPTEIKSGSYLTSDKNYAKVYESPSASSLTSSNAQMLNKRSGIPQTHEYIISKNAKIFDVTNPSDLKKLDGYWKTESTSGEFLPTKTGQLDWTEAENVAEFLKKKGYKYDGIIVGEGGGFTPEGLELKRADSIKIINPKVLQTKSQLTDIWNKANKK